MQHPVEAKGTNGTITWDGAMVTLRRTGFFGRNLVGKGNKVIPIGNVQSVQWKPAGVVIGGYLQFVIAGSNDTRARFGRQTWDALDDENTVVFDRSQEPGFAVIHEAVLAALSRPAVGGGEPPVIDQLERLGRLRDAGVVTVDEFERAKAGLLARLA